MSKFARFALLTLAAAAALGGCAKNFTAYALTSTGSILKFNTNKPGTINNNVKVNGLTSGKGIAAMAYGTDGKLYCITSDNFVCTLNPDTGAASVIGSAPFTNGLANNSNASQTLTNPSLSFDPVAKQLRVITSEDNLRVGIDGTLVTNPIGTKLAYDKNDSNNGKSPVLAGIAYSNPLSGASSTTLYVLDSTTGNLARVGDADATTPVVADGGDLHTIGSAGVSFSSFGGLAIEPANGNAYAALQPSGTGATLYTVDLKSGAATSVGTISDGNQTISALVIPPGQ